MRMSFENAFVNGKKKRNFITKPHPFQLRVQLAGFQFFVEGYFPLVGVLKQNADEF